MILALEATVHAWRKQLEIEGLLIRKEEPGAEHSAEQKQQGLDKELLKQREAVYEAARCQHPERWSGKTRNWTPASTVALNPENEYGRAA